MNDRIGKNLLKERLSILEKKCSWVIRHCSSQKNTYSRAYHHLDNQLKECQKELSRLSRWLDIKQMPLTGAQAQLFEIQKRCRFIFNDALAFLHGRWRYSDDKTTRILVDIAEALNEELGRLLNLTWGRPVVLAEEDFITDCTGIIRLGFPLVDPCSLVVVAHEFAHHLMSGRAQPDTGGNTLANFFHNHLDYTTESDFRHLNELTSDLFATIALGPAYGYACLLLLFDPTHAGSETATHPTPNRRAKWILDGLIKMDSDFHGIVQILAKYWAAQGGDQSIYKRIQCHKTALEREQDILDINKFESIFQFLTSGSFCRLKWSGMRHIYEYNDSAYGQFYNSQRYEARDILNIMWYKYLHAFYNDMNSDISSIEMLNSWLTNETIRYQN